MKYYLLYDESMSAPIFGVMNEGETLSTNHPVEWLDSEEDLAVKVDAVFGKGYYESHKEIE